MPGENVFLPNDTNKRDSQLLSVKYNSSRKYAVRDDQQKVVEIEDFENFIIDDLRKGKLNIPERNYVSQALKSISLRVNYLRLFYQGQDLLAKMQDDEYIKFAKDGVYKFVHLSVSTHDGRRTMVDSMLTPHSIQEVRDNSIKEENQPKGGFLSGLKEEL